MRLKPLSTRWKSWEDCVEALRAAGFAPTSVQAPSPSLWTGLSQARSAEIPEVPATAYTYVGAKWRAEKLTSGWGLLLLDTRCEASSYLPLLAKGGALLTCSHPDAALDFLLKQCSDEEWTGPSAAIPAGVRAEAGVLLGPGCELGEGVILEQGVRLGAGVRIGAHTRICAHSRIADGCEIGSHTWIGAQASIGGPGFGFVLYPGSQTRVPRQHVGRVRIGNHVRLGSLVTVDRGVFEDTVIADGASTDNIVQVAHNCRVGRHAVLCSFVGLSGSTHLGERVTIAGMVGTSGHNQIGNDVTIAAQSGVNCDIPDGASVKGYPPRPLSEALRLQALWGRLPEFFDRLKNVEKKLEEK